MTTTAPQMRRISPTLILTVLLAAGLVVRVVFLIELEGSGFADVLSLDARFYNDLARGVVAGGGLPEGPFTFNPLYPLFLIGMFRLFGTGLIAPRIVQTAVGLATIALIFLATRALERADHAGKRSRELRPGRFADLTAALAAALAAAYAQFMLYEGTPVATTFEVFFMIAAFAIALTLDEDRGGGRHQYAGRRVSPRLRGLLLGASCGAGALGRPNLFLLLAVALPVWLWLRNRRGREGLALAACCAAGTALLLLPPILYNARATGRFVPVAAHGGINFYIGNGAGSDGTYRSLDEMRSNIRGTIEDARSVAEAETGRRMTAAEVSDYFAGRAFDDIRHDPSAWLRLLGRKFMLFFNGREIADMPSIFFYEKSCGVLKLLFMPFGVIASLSVCGLFILLGRGRSRTLFVLFLGCALVSVVLFFVNTRYRLPAVPIMIVLAASSLGWMWRELSQGRLRGVAAMAAAAVAFFFLVSHRSMVTINPSYQYAFLGNYYLENGNEAKAAEAFAEAYRLAPDRPEAIINHARILRQTGKLRESIEAYARAHERAPGFPDLAIEYGFALQLQGRLEEAKKLYFEAASSSRTPERLTACKLLAQAAAMEGRKTEAIQWVKRALEIAPRDAQAAGMLARIEDMPDAAKLP